jgi:hypothetical protein
LLQERTEKVSPHFEGYLSSHLKLSRLQIERRNLIKKCV